MTLVNMGNDDVLLELSCNDKVLIQANCEQNNNSLRVLGEGCVIIELGEA